MDDYEELRKAFIDRYGPPTLSESKEVQNRMGAKFQNEELEWRGTVIKVSLSRYGRNLEKGSVSLSTLKVLDKMQAVVEEKRKKAAESF